MMHYAIYPLGEAALCLQPNRDQAGAQQRLIAMTRLAAAQPEYRLILGVGNVTLRFDPLQQSLMQAEQWLKNYWEETALQLDELPSRIVEIPVHYGGESGPDLAQLAELAGLSEAQLIEAHSAPLYDVLCIGFLPGFPYLAGLPDSLHTPRRASPRLRVPAGSVGIGGNQTGIYPCESPGGWQLIGRTRLALFDPRAQTPCLLQAGDKVRFVPEETS
ncbi:5-oxoprolinase subunit PxpB [Chitinibacter sp. S2-10]|uniref:5-oxoprolinase subunit PxpB n=1 Tax=Chitinibacter sp. S2-10 TaxID=3373597 RepID=UPI003977A087